MPGLSYSALLGIIAHHRAEPGAQVNNISFNVLPPLLRRLRCFCAVLWLLLSLISL